MAAPRLVLSDIFSNWFTKINQIAQEVDGTSSKTGDPLAINLPTGTHNTLSAAMNTLVGFVGSLTSLTTSTKTSIVDSINEVVTKLNQIGIPVITVGTEASNVIRVSVQMKDKAGDNLTFRSHCKVYLSDNSSGSNLSSAEPSGGIAIGSEGFFINKPNNLMVDTITGATGLLHIDITEAAAKTYYLCVVYGEGKIVVSNAITFTV